MTPAAFELRGVAKRVRVGDGQLTILRDIDLTIAQGEYIAVMGPSGSGKSTLLNLLGCLDLPSAGTLSLLGREVASLSDDEISALRRRSLGFVFQSFHLLPSYDALANVAMALAYGGAPDRWPRARRFLEEMGLGHRLHHRPSMMSGGEQQRVAIARAVANGAAILLADEPTGALDQANGGAILDHIDRLHQSGRTVVMVTHDPHVAQRAQRVIEMVDGAIRSDRRRPGSAAWKN